MENSSVHAIRTISNGTKVMVTIELTSQKENRKLAEQLAAKKYLTLLEDSLRNEQKAIDFYLRHHAAAVDSAEQLLADTSEYAELLSPFFSPLYSNLL